MKKPGKKILMRMKNKILSKLKELEKQHNVKILWAIESGSRAWKFASEDSDYDVRCMHISKKEDYLGLEEVPKQINYSKNELDIESWDIKKFASLMIKSNPQIAEWLKSPIIYQDSETRKDLKKMFDKGCSLEFLKTHYLRMSKQNYQKYVKDKEKSPCKKYLYVLRGIACAEYIQRENRLPPLPYEKVIPYLPKYIQEFFGECVIKKNKTEGELIKPKEKITKFIEENLKLEDITQTNKYFKGKEKLNGYIVNTILKN